MRVRIDSVGCRLNIGEAEHLARALAVDGHCIVGPGEAADLMVFNTCAVTHVAARKSRKLIRHWRRANPTAALVVTGCYAELSPGEVAALGVDLVVGNQDKDELPRLLKEAGILRDAQVVPAPDAFPLQPDGAPAGNRNGRTRAFVKVQDGCDNRCTFCIVTVARGDSRSRGVSEIVAEIRELVDAGYREAVLSGVHLGSYGHDRNDQEGLLRLVRAILDETTIPRLRLSSLEPWDLGAEFFSLWAQDPRLLPHVHLPLQSGCDETLRRMARRTDQASFRALVGQAREAVPELSITTDIIVGFPGESDAEFETSLGFVEEMEFAKLHVFRYSPREGTVAATMPGRVPPPVAQQRSNRMHALGAVCEAGFKARFIGRTVPVLWESAEPRPECLRWSGLTGNYIRVVTETGEDVDLANEVTETTLIRELPGAVLGVAQIRERRETRAV
ncbi:MAG: tRNA (N(6)-L-threonylcarbamoyladenosine(37)-C(2))-methylthiotransferase MtaB [Acidobacteria bacterium]|nr:tRNA (N(6)-L-threonylcarbamoyladenosine(37)-C(2))-methylthiotransferase MtaB [Acidobacteriota bacterium]